MSSALLNTMAGRRTFLRLWFDPGIENGGRNGSGFLAIVLKLCLRFELPRSIPCLKLEADCRKLETNLLNLGFLSTAGTTCTGLNEGIGWIGRFWNAGNRTGVACLDLKFGSLRGRFLSGAFLNGALDLHCLGAAYFPKSLVSREGFNLGLRGLDSFLECRTKLWDFGIRLNWGALAGLETGVGLDDTTFALCSSFFWSACTAEARSNTVP